jgi:alkylation response protein AidB-like acyl-CoA dehydrogenase
MPIAVTDDHLELAAVVADFAQRQDLTRRARSLLEASEELQRDLWDELANVGWLGLHLPEAQGGSGYGLTELGVVVEALGAAVCPGPFLPTVMASAVLAAGTDAALCERWLPALADGSTIAGIGFDEVVLGAGLADIMIVARGDDMVLVERGDVEVSELGNLDHTRRVARVVVPEGAGTSIGCDRATAIDITRALAAAEAAGVARACTEMSTTYAKERVQFGRVIGSFMAVKHHCANMLVQAELATASAWDALNASAVGGEEFRLSAAAAVANALPAATWCGEMNIQLHGGIGYTWEHDAHLYMRRAGALHALFGSVDQARQDVFELTSGGVTRDLRVELPPEAETYRAQVRAFLDGYADLAPSEQRLRLVDEGYLYPHWPRPYGREADAVEQIVIEEEFGDLERHDMGIGGWVTLTFTQHGTPEQVERWTRPSMLGETRWCQMFSEPDAGSDAAGVKTRGERVEGGWIVNGQKVWTSGAQNCTHGFATVRTDPDAPKHKGITMMAIDLAAEGVTIRPLRTIAGLSHFNEIFLDNVFVPDDDVVGPVDDGWSVARATLGNERVSIGSGRVTRGSGIGTDRLVEIANERHSGDVGAAREVGALLSESHAMRVLNLRSVLRAVLGSEPSAEGNITKLLNSEHGQRVAALGMRLSGSAGAAVTDDNSVAQAWISIRSLSIAGGTSEISRNQIGERILGLPREPGLK